MAEMVGEVASHVALEALERGVGEDQDMTGTVHPVLDLDEEIRMLNSVRLAAEEAAGNPKNFVPPKRKPLGSVLKML